MVLYATSPLCIFTVLYCSTGVINQHHRNAEVNIDIPSNHPSLLRIALSLHRHHPRHLKILFHLDTKSSMTVRISQDGRRMFTTHDIPFQSIFVKGVDACSYPCSFRIYPCLSARSFNNFLKIIIIIELTPVRVLITFPTKPISDLRFQMPKKA